MTLAPGGEVVVEGLVGRATMRVAARYRPWVRASLARADARAPHALHQDWAPCCCPACDRCYRAAHWRLAVRPAGDAGDVPGWYEGTDGTCPAGHTRAVDE